MLPNFGNAGEVNNCLSAAAQRLLKCVKNDPSIASDRPLFSRFQESAGAEQTDVAALFSDLASVGSIVTRFEKIRNVCLQCKKKGKEPRDAIPMNFRFVGAPGTGKTTVAKRIGKLYESLGILGSSEVNMKSVSDFVTGYAQQAAKQTQMIFKESLGRVLFIDEAYRLTESREVLDEIVQLLTDET